MDEISSPRSSLKFHRPRIDQPIGRGPFPVAEPNPQKPATKAAPRIDQPPSVLKQSSGRRVFPHGFVQQDEHSAFKKSSRDAAFAAKLAEKDAARSDRRKYPLCGISDDVLASHVCVARKQDLCSGSYMSADSHGKSNTSVSQGIENPRNVHATKNVGSVSKDSSLHHVNSSLGFTRPLSVSGATGARQMRSDVNLGSRELDWCRESSDSRARVKEVLDLYRRTLTKLLKNEDRKSHKQKGIGLHIEAAMLLKNGHKWINTSKRLGSIPGVEIGDKFLCRAELNVVGLHCRFQSGIDYVKKNGIAFATSIVATDLYANDLGSSNVLIYSGEGGNPLASNRQPLRDQCLERGNLALKNSMDSKYPVRVIRKVKPKKSKLASLRGGASRKSSNPSFVYDGLYMVEKYWQERGSFGKLVFKFKLERISGQPKLTRRLAI